MKDLLHKITEEGFILEVVKGDLKVFSTKEDVNSDLLEAIKQNKEELISYLTVSEQSSIQNEAYQAIPRSEPRDHYPVSNAQLRLWLASQTMEGSLAYNMPNTLILDGAYNLENFKKALFKVVQRHEILRTVFQINEEGEVCQVIIPFEQFDFFIDIKDFSNSDKPLESELRQYISEDSLKPFDLSNGPLLRSALLRLSDSKQVFYFNMHHIISDEWSMEILSDEVMNFYETYQKELKIDEPELGIQYKDYAIWQLDQLNRPNFNTQKDYWKKQFKKDIITLELPTSKKRPQQRTFNGGAISGRFPPCLTTQLRDFVAERGGSLFMGLLSIWKILIHHYTAETDIIIGNPTAGRDHPDLERQIGLYLNILPIRNQIDTNDTFSDLFEKIKSSILGAHQNQMYPFDKIVDDVKLVRDTSRNPLFDILVDFHGKVSGPSKMSDNNDYKVLEDGMVKFDLELHLSEVSEGVDFTIRYNKDIYEEWMVKGLVKHFKNLAKALLSSVHKRISDIEFLTEPERNELIHGLNMTNHEVYSDKTVADLFTTQAELTPHAIALEFEGIQLSYEELEHQSNQLANCLQQQYDIKKGDFVGVHLDRSAQYIISLFGIIKAGGVFTPIDTMYPSERKAYILKDSKVRLLISDTNYMFDMDYFDGELLAIDVAFDPALYEKEFENQLMLSDLAYIIYTSGSTGTPKGVMIEHAALINYLSWGKSYYFNEKLSNKDFGLFTSPSFDLTISSFFLPLISGGRLKIFNNETDHLAILKEYLSDNISCVKLTPSHIDIMGELELENGFLELAIVGGEELKETHIEILRSINPKIRIINEYGPTEATVGCVVYEIKESGAPIYIGKPISNTQIYILNSKGRLAPKGVLGEIYIGGAGLSKGYLNQSELTSERFIENPFKKGEKFYRTGDLARWMPNDNLDFKGRIDHQIKIYGYRIELEEIESVLNQVQGVYQSVVIPRQDKNDFQFLVAFVKAEKGLEKKDLQQFLEKMLPSYMVPKLYVFMDEIPLTNNGKVNREALPDPVQDSYGNGNYVAPTTESETLICSVWEEVLGIENIGVHDNFFDLGGQSLLGIRLSFALSKRCNVKFEINTIFSYPTIHLQAQYLDVILMEEQEKEPVNEEIIYL